MSIFLHALLLCGGLAPCAATPGPAASPPRPGVEVRDLASTRGPDPVCTD